jgi:hypothetical protein
VQGSQSCLRGIGRAVDDEGEGAHASIVAEPAFVLPKTKAPPKWGFVWTRVLRLLVATEGAEQV